MHRLSTMSGHYDIHRVLLSLVISILASWAALDISGRVSLQVRESRRTAWLCAGAFAMGLGIWTMHYVGMLAYLMPMSVLYDWPTVLLSLCAAVFSSAGALFIVSRRTLSWSRTLPGSLFMGGGIAAMHYIGMAAMRMPATMTYRIWLVVLSVGVAIAISIAALRLTFGSRNVLSAWSGRKAASALLMGCAIPVMHYIGMAAARWTPGPGNVTADDLRHAIAINDLSTAGIIVVTTLVLVIALISAGIDRHLLRYQSDLQEKEQNNHWLQEHTDRLQSAFRAGGVGMWECDPSTGLFYVDACLRDMYDIEHDGRPVARDHWKSRVHPDDVATLDRRWKQSLATGDIYENEYRVQRRAGCIRHYRSVASIVRSSEGVVRRVTGMTWDVTAERQQEQAVADQAERFRMTLEAIGDAVISTDEQQRITFLNRAASQLTGWSAEEATGRTLEEVFITFEEQGESRLRNPVLRCMEGGENLLAEKAVLAARQQDRYDVRLRVAMMNDGKAAVLTFQDITDSRRMKQKLKFAAMHDTLTGLPNRASFERRLREVWEETRETQRTHCLCIVDLDRFKIINETSGHMAGDALLRVVAEFSKPASAPRTTSLAWVGMSLCCCCKTATGGKANRRRTACWA